MDGAGSIPQPATFSPHVTSDKDVIKGLKGVSTLETQSIHEPGQLKTPPKLYPHGKCLADVLPPVVRVGPLTINLIKAPSLKKVQMKNRYVTPGGYFSPRHCFGRYRTAVIIPHRNRESHLRTLLYYLHPFLQRQQLHYAIFVVHQVLEALIRRKEGSRLVPGRVRGSWEPSRDTFRYLCPIDLYWYRYRRFPIFFGYRPILSDTDTFKYRTVSLNTSTAGNATFNRAKLLNIGVREALRYDDWDCLILHDVDLVPENDHNLYICDEYYPKHLSSAMDKFQYSLPYWAYFGGVSALTPDQFMKMNGFPNTYWGWGGEDDDIAMRIRLSGMSMTRTPLSIGRYKMIPHDRDSGNEENSHRHNLLSNTRKTWRDDGMNSLHFQLLSREKIQLFTNITVDIGEAPVMPTEASRWRLF
ncbi:unnamed protein product [Ranitomeya imitator]|uniref:Beta-1,4-galactosyltransferase n=1 Tax=Ranitomeya imitator TaxID=111125 RepID=A0ABN9M0Z1_9NEOB|nr:unnamed protein product [Ranitomeya imitator]